MKATNNDDYRVKPVYGFLDPQGTAPFEITRTAGPAKEDKFIVQIGAAQPEDADPEAAFKGTAQIGETTLSVIAVDATCM